jgi:Domain of unknown function (DUF4352)
MKLKPITAIAVLLLVVASLLVAGCTQTTTPTNTPTASQQVVVTATPTTTAREQVSAVKVTVPQQIGKYAPNASNKFVAYNVTIRNIDVDMSSSNPFNFQLRDTEGNIYQPSTATFDNSFNAGLKNMNTQPGDKVSGIIVFEVRQNATLKSLTYFSGYQRTIITL